MPRRLTLTLRILASAVPAVLCVLVLALWVRSYSRHDIVTVPLSSQTTVKTVSILWETKKVLVEKVAQLGSMGGGLEFRLGLTNAGYPLGLVSTDRKFYPMGQYRHAGQNGHGLFATFSNESNFGSLAPHWFVANVLAIATYLPWIRRYTLRGMLIAMTAVALGLGGIVWAGK